VSLDMSHPLLMDETITTVNGYTTAGTVPPLVAPRVVRRVKWLSLNDDECYPGFEVKAWLNPSHMQRRLLDVTEGDRASAFIKLIVLEHNGWVDEEGEAYPPASDAAFWDAIPMDLAIRTITVVNDCACLEGAAMGRR
jgi:hypothetical protein